MKFAISHYHFSTAFYCHAICHTSHFTVVNCDTATLDNNESLIFISFLLKGYILDTYVTCTTFQQESIILTTAD